MTEQGGQGSGAVSGAQSLVTSLEAAGVTDILTKVYGSTNKLNLVKATIEGLKQLRTKDEVARLRGVSL